jgi:hypothetical protein
VAKRETKGFALYAKGKRIRYVPLTHEELVWLLQDFADELMAARLDDEGLGERVYEEVARAWRDRIDGLLEPPPDGRPQKTEFPLWKAWARAKAENPELTKWKFIVGQHGIASKDPQRRDKIKRGLSLLEREEKGARKLRTI